MSYYLLKESCRFLEWDNLLEGLESSIYGIKRLEKHWRHRNKCLRMQANLWRKVVPMNCLFCNLNSDQLTSWSCMAEQSGLAGGFLLLLDFPLYHSGLADCGNVQSYKCCVCAVETVWKCVNSVIVVVLVRYVVVSYFIKRKCIIKIFNGKLRTRFHSSVKY